RRYADRRVQGRDGQGVVRVQGLLRLSRIRPPHLLPRPLGREPPPHGPVDGAADPPPGGHDQAGSHLSPVVRSIRAADAARGSATPRSPARARVPQPPGSRVARVRAEMRRIIMKRWLVLSITALVGLYGASHLAGCVAAGGVGGVKGTVAERVYVKPGDHD